MTNNSQKPAPRKKPSTVSKQKALPKQQPPPNMNYQSPAPKQQLIGEEPEFVTTIGLGKLEVQTVTTDTPYKP